MTIYRFAFQLVMDETKNTSRIIVSVLLFIFWLYSVVAYLQVLALIVPSFVQGTNPYPSYSDSQLILVSLWAISLISPVFVISSSNMNYWIDFEWKNHLRSFTFKKKKLFRHHTKYLLNPMLLYLEEEYSSGIDSRDITEPPILDVTDRALIQKLDDRYSLFYNRGWIIIVPVLFTIGPLFTSVVLLVARLPMLLISYLSSFPIELIVSLVVLVSSILTYYIAIGFIVVFAVRGFVWKNLLFNLDYRTDLQNTLNEINAAHVGNFEENIEKLRLVYAKQSQALSHLNRLLRLPEKDKESIVWYWENNKVEDRAMKTHENAAQKVFDIKLGLFFWFLGVVSTLLLEGLLK